MKHYIIVEDTDCGSVHVQALKQGTEAQLAEFKAGKLSPASYVADQLVTQAISLLALDDPMPATANASSATPSTKH